MKKLLSLTLALMMIIACLSGLALASDAEASWTDGTTTVEGTFADMAKQAGEKGGTLTLLKDYTYESEKGNAITANKSFTLDLNGKTLTSKSTGVAVSAKADGITVIKNGTLIATKMCVSVKGGGLKMDGVTAWSDKNQNVSYYVTSDKWNKDNLIENCIFGNAAWGAFSFNNTEESMAKVAFAFKNSTLATTKTSTPFVMQTKAEAGTIVLGEGVTLMTKGKSTNASALFLFGEALTKAEGTHDIEVAGNAMTGLNKWTTPETATKEMVIPEAGKVISSTPAEDVVASWTNGLTTIEGTIDEIASQVKKAGGTVTILKDFTDNREKGNLINTSKAFTLDLNGKTVTTPNIVPFVVSSAVDGVTTIKNGTLIGENAANLSLYGGIVLQNLTLWTDKSQNINYYDMSGKWNTTNIIENCTIGNSIWGALAFNKNSSDAGAQNNQEKTSVTIKNSTFIAAKTKGTTPIVIQAKAVSANVVLGEGVKMYSYLKNEGNYAAKAIFIHGEEMTMAADKSVTILDKTFDMMTEWTTPATATVDLTKVIPTVESGAAAETPATPSTPTTTPATPATPATPTTPGATTETEKKPTTPTAKPVAPVEQPAEGGSMGIIIGIVAAVVVIAVVAVVVLKKKKQ